MKYKVKRFFREGKRFKREHRRELRLLVIITLGFTIAFTWRQTIFDTFQSLVNFIVGTKSTSVSSTLTSVLITLVSLILIRISSHILKDSSDN